MTSLPERDASEVMSREEQSALEQVLMTATADDFVDAPRPEGLITGVCKTCGDPCWWQECPTGGWWIHNDKKTGYLARHIAEHDADPGWAPCEHLVIAPIFGEPGWGVCHDCSDKVRMWEDL